MDVGREGGMEWMKGERKEGRERLIDGWMDGWMDEWGTKFYNKLKQGSISMPQVQQILTQINI